MKNLLVFPCGTEIGLAINRALVGAKDFVVYGGSSVEDHGRLVYSNYIPHIPHVDSPEFIPAISNIVKCKAIDCIIPAHDSVVLKLVENQAFVGADILTAKLETCKICRSKRATYKYFKNILPTPTIYETEGEVIYPAFLKPDIGQGAKGTYLAKSWEEICFYKNLDPTLLVLEYLPGDEYTVDCFTSNNGELLYAEARKRVRINGGISVNSVRINDPQFKILAKKINSSLNFRGVWFFQLKERANKELVLLEISPRIAGTMDLARANGVNLLLLSLYQLAGFNIKILDNNVVKEIDRALFSRYLVDFDYSHVYIDFDDTIIINGIVNAFVMHFLYQVKMKGKKIYLLTRHKGNIFEKLRYYSISENLFNEIIVVDNGEKKSRYIKHRDTIFIDDSFKERLEVHDSLGIPVFSVDAIECLVDWRI